MIEVIVDGFVNALEAEPDIHTYIHTYRVLRSAERRSRGFFSITLFLNYNKLAGPCEEINVFIRVSGIAIPFNIRDKNQGCRIQIGRAHV